MYHRSEKISRVYKSSQNSIYIYECICWKQTSQIHQFINQSDNNNNNDADDNIIINVFEQNAVTQCKYTWFH